MGVCGRPSWGRLLAFPSFTIAIPAEGTRVGGQAGSPPHEGAYDSPGGMPTAWRRNAAGVARNKGLKA